MAQSSATIPTTDKTQATPTLYNNLVNDITELYSCWVVAPVSTQSFPGEIWEYSAENSDKAYTLDANIVDVTSATGSRRYRTGDRVRFRQGGAFIYAVVGQSVETNSVTTKLRLAKHDGLNVTLTSVTPITDIQWSTRDNPSGFPARFRWQSGQARYFLGAVREGAPVDAGPAPALDIRYQLFGQVAHLNVIASCTGLDATFAVATPFIDCIPTAITVGRAGIRVIDLNVLQDNSGVGSADNMTIGEAIRFRPKWSSGIAAWAIDILDADAAVRDARGSFTLLLSY